AVQTSLDALPNDELAVAAALSAVRHVHDADIDGILEKNRLHEFIDGLQIDFGAVHNAISETWFLPRT
ncbi:MAG: alpha-E domain-containing protein, partial [Gammaproteobacteria bacterium]